MFSLLHGVLDYAVRFGVLERLGSILGALGSPRGPLRASEGPIFDRFSDPGGDPKIAKNIRVVPGKGVLGAIC